MKKALLPLLVAALFLLPACSSSLDTDGGTLRILLTDAPADEFKAANVTITRIELVADDSTRILLTEGPQDFNLLTLRNGVTVEIAEKDLPAAEYVQVRVYVAADAEVVFLDDTRETLKVPSGSIKFIRLPTLDMNDETDTATILLDFDVNDSFVKAGNSGKYIFKPVVKVKSVTYNGTAIDD